MSDPKVLQKLAQAWSQSDSYAPAVPIGQPGSQKREQGGWILMNWVTGNLILMPVAPGSRDRIDLSPFPRIVYHTPVGWYHTHPNTPAEGYYDPPSTADQGVTDFAKVPGVVRTHSGDYFTCPP
jgi:hypothetical protein